MDFRVYLQSARKLDAKSSAYFGMTAKAERLDQCVDGLRMNGWTD